MPVHIFQVDERNFEICRKKGLAGIFDAKKENIDDTLISHLMLLKKGDPVLFYVGKGKGKGTKGKSKKELHGIWKIASEPFYDTTPIWSDQLYPYRVCVEEMVDSMFDVPLKLSDVYHLRDTGQVWTFSLMRNFVAVNAVFSMTNQEYNAIFDEFIKLNPGGGDTHYLVEPYEAPNSPLNKRIRYKNNNPQYESSLMALIAQGLVKQSYTSVFQNYNDYSFYIPTNWGKEIDILLLHSHPNKPNVVSSYDIVEVKRDTFGEEGLEQLLNYESWFINKRVKGDSNMIRSIAIAKSFSKKVTDYLKAREKYENKHVILLTYGVNEHQEVVLTPVSY